MNNNPEPIKDLPEENSKVRKRKLLTDPEKL
jgi:hypothetical protein